MLKKVTLHKRLLAALLFLIIVIACGSGSILSMDLKAQNQNQVAKSAVAKATTKTPKYIFMFIGDGIAAVQVNSAQIYKGSNKHNQIALKELNFQDFEAVGYQTTHDATSFAPDSAFTATSLSLGFKTWSGTIGLKPIGNKSGNKAENVDVTKVPKTIDERLKAEKGMKIGIVSTITINHATPAAYYAHVAFDNLISKMKAKNPKLSFNKVFSVITENFGLVNETTGDISRKGEPSYMTLELSDREMAKLKTAFVETMSAQPTDNEETDLLYGNYNPLSVNNIGVYNLRIYKLGDQSAIIKIETGSHRGERIQANNMLTVRLSADKIFKEGDEAWGLIGFDENNNINFVNMIDHYRINKEIIYFVIIFENTIMT